MMLFVFKPVLGLCLILALSAIAVSGQDSEEASTSNTIRIVNGIPARRSPTYMVSVQRETAQGTAHTCGGVIIGPTIVLTAASCVSGRSVDELFVLAGVADLRSNRGSWHSVDDYVVQNKWTQGNNIALLKVVPHFHFGPSISMKNFTNNSTAELNDIVYLYGFGKVDANAGVPSYISRQLDATVRGIGLCQNFYPNLNETAICAYKSLGQGTCAGDEGGPAVSADDGELVGIISYGPITCGVGFPDVITRISIMVDWIAQVATMLSNDDVPIFQ